MDTTRSPISPRNWNVIIGASCSGKTTLVEALAKRGYRVVHEAARLYIDKHLAQGETLAEIRKDEVLFQKNILKMKIAIEHAEAAQAEDRITFFDRGIPDTYAFYSLLGVEEDKILDDASKSRRYKKVFLLDQLPYVKDYVRTETEEEQHILHELLESSYAKLGFPIVRVPVLPVEERVQFVINHL